MDALLTLRIAAGLCAAVWVYLALFRGDFWRLSQRLDGPGHAELPRAVTAVIPARNEAALIGATVASLRAQQFRGSLRVVVADDESHDGTGAVSGADVVVSTPPRPAGWKGKLWAVHSGLDAAACPRADFFLLTDADIQYVSSSVLRQLIAKAETGFDLVSVMVRLECQTTAERLLIPAFVFFFFMLYPPRWVQSRRYHTAAAAGGCMLIRRATMEKIGGVESIRDALIDDCALAARVKSTGGRVWLGLAGADLRSVRPYATFDEIHQMIARAAFAQLKHSWLLLAGTVVGLLFTYVLPVALTFSGDRIVSGLGMMAWSLSAALFAPTVAEYQAPVATLLGLPAIALFYLRATVASALHYSRGKGGVWKDRVQDPAG